MLRRLLSGFLATNDDASVAHQIYGAVVAQSRNPAFYGNFGIPDTVIGRLDMLNLHQFLLSRRLSREKDETALKLSQEAFDLHIDDLDRALREIGIGDNSVPKRKKRMIRGFYGQIEDFGVAIDTQDIPALAAKVAGRFYRDAAGDRPAALASYMLAAALRLEKQPFAALAQGRLDWPDPLEFAP